MLLERESTVACRFQDHFANTFTLATFKIIE
jgi:hypothetical protein